VLDVIRVRHLAHRVDVALQDSAQKRADNRLDGHGVIGKGTGGKQSGGCGSSQGLFHGLVPFSGKG
jgi:hypothetical protein